MSAFFLITVLLISLSFKFLFVIFPSLFFTSFFMLLLLFGNTLSPWVLC